MRGAGRLQPPPPVAIVGAFDGWREREGATLPRAIAVPGGGGKGRRADGAADMLGQRLPREPLAAPDRDTHARRQECEAAQRNPTISFGLTGLLRPVPGVTPRPDPLTLLPAARGIPPRTAPMD